MSAGPSPIRILTVDDHPLICQGIAALVADQSDMSLLSEAPNGREAILLFRAHRPDITLMNLQMPEMDGLDAIIARVLNLCTVQVQYRTDHLHWRRPGPKAGARAYLLKNLLIKELPETIRAVHAGKESLSPEASYQLAEHATDDALTPAEIAVLRLITLVLVPRCRP